MPVPGPTSVKLKPSALAEELLPGPIGFLLIPRYTAIAFSSALESLRIANRYTDNAYRWRLLSADAEPVVDSNGTLTPVQGRIEDTDELGTLLICSDLEPERYATPHLSAILQRLALRGTTLGGLDTGAYFLARAGVLDYHRATLHWENAPAFSERYPRIRLTRNLFEFDRRRVTCAGGTAAIDMMLLAIAARHGKEVAVRVSEHFLHARIREGTEAQRLGIPERFGVHHPKVADAIRFMEQAIDDQPAATSEIARHVGISERQLSRLFRENLGESPSRFYVRRRLERARGLIQQSERSILDIALACGFQSQSHFTRLYRQSFGETPQAGRRAMS